MSFAAAWLRVDLRRRWRSWVALALLVAVASGTVLAAVAGARRAETAQGRLVERTLPATAAVLPNEPGFDWDAVRAMPEVEAVATFLLGPPFPVTDDVTGEAVDEGFGFAPGDAAWGSAVDRPVVLAGRLPDPARADEVLVTPRYLELGDRRIGDTLTARLFTPEQVASQAAAEGSPPDPAGPVVRLRIVGVGLSVWTHDAPGSPGAVQPSPGLAARYRENLYDDATSYTNALVRLHGGAAALPAFQERLAEVTGRSDIDVWDVAAALRQEQRGVAFEARSLLAFAAAAIVAALFLVGQAAARYTTATLDDLRLLRGSGMGPSEAARVAVAAPVLAAVVGAAGGVLLAVAASPAFPLGAAGLMEVERGVDVDGLVLGAGLVLVPLGVLLVAAGAAWLALRREGSTEDARPSAVAQTAAVLGLPVPVVVGAGFALGGGRGRTAAPVRSAVVGAVAGVLGVVGAFTFADGVADAAADPARFGQTWQVGAFLGFNDAVLVDDAPALLAGLAAAPGVTAVNDARIGVAHAGPSAQAVTLLSHDPVDAPLPVVLTEGRLPAGATEVVLGPSAADGLGVAVGDRLTVEGPAGARDLDVVGLGFVPASPHSSYADGGWLSSDGYAGLFGDTFKFRFAQLALADDADPEAAIAALGGGPGASPDLFFVWEDEFPTPVDQLRSVQGLPVALGGFLAVLAVGAVGHALATALRRRRVDVAVLQALGMTPRQTRVLVSTQAGVLAVAGLLLGVPLGLALGRTAWRTVADYTPLAYVPPLAVAALLLVGPVALLVANALAAWPGHVAARLRIADVLRTE